MVKRIAILALAALFLSAPALAQQPASPPSDPVASISQDWQAYVNAQRHVTEDLQALIQQVQHDGQAKANFEAQIADLKKQLDAAKAATTPAPTEPAK